MNSPKLSRSRILLVLGVALTAWLVACGEDDSVTDPPDPSVVVYDPKPGDLTSSIFKVVRFHSADESGRAIESVWFVDDVESATAADFSLQPETAVQLEIRAESVLEGRPFSASWQLAVSEEGTLPTPPVALLWTVPGPQPGMVDLSWERPPPSQIQIPLEDFLVYHDDLPIDPLDPGGAELTVVAYNDQVILQRLQLTELAEDAPYYVRIVVRDVTDRVSEISEQSETIVTGHFDLFGNLVAIAPLQPVDPLGQVLVDVDGRREISASDGSFSFFTLPFYPEVEGYTPPPGLQVLLRESSGINYYEMRSPQPLPRIEQTLDFAMIPRDIVLLQPDDPGDPSSMDRLAFVRLMTHNNRVAADLPAYRWDLYPVTVYAPERTVVREGGAVVDYRLAFANAVTAWNDAAGEELLRLAAADAIETPPGIIYSVDLPTSGGLLGETVQDLPAGGQLFRSAPELVRVRCIEYSTQEVADRIISHEVGHALMLAHSPSLGHNMHASVAVPDVDRDEAYIARLLRYMPQGMDLKWYVDSSKWASTYRTPSPSDLCGTEPLHWEQLR